MTARPPTRVVLVFSEKIALNSDAIRVLDPTGKRVDDAHPTPQGGTAYAVGLPTTLAHGTYTVAYSGPHGPRGRGTPALIVADEPTGQLDADTGRTVMELLRAVVHSEGVTALVATHDPELLALADRVIELNDGTLVDSV